MRYGPEHKQATHARILAAAESLFRQHGFEGASVERIMRAAGLTVGGFYAHFATKETLVVEGLRAWLQGRRARWTGGLEGLGNAEWRSTFVRRYLRREVRDDAQGGCLLPSVLSDFTRATPAVQAMFAEELDALARDVQAHQEDGPGVTARQKALATLALCFGAMTLARATASQPFSDEVLAAAQALLGAGKKDSPSPPARRA